MKLNITYSLFEELKEVYNITVKYKDNNYSSLRSVIMPTPRILFTYLMKSSIAIKEIEKLWLTISGQIEKAIETNKLKVPSKINCYLHSFSCEGWFNVDDNSIHVRYTKYDDDKKELLNTIVHEILHLATYNKKMSYMEREKLVDEYLSRPEFKKLV